MKSYTPLFSMLLMSLIALSGCTNEVEEVAEGEAQTGEVVTVTGEVIRVLDSRSFSMKDEHEWLEDNPLVVVSSTNLPTDFNDEDEVTVTGTVRNVAYTEIESGYDWDFDPEIEAELEEVRGFLIADSVRVTEHE